MSRRLRQILIGIPIVALLVVFSVWGWIRLTSEPYEYDGFPGYGSPDEAAAAFAATMARVTLDEFETEVAHSDRFDAATYFEAESGCIDWSNVEIELEPNELASYEVAVYYTSNERRVRRTAIEGAGGWRVIAESVCSVV